MLHSLLQDAAVVGGKGRAGRRRQGQRCSRRPGLWCLAARSCCLKWSRLHGRVLRRTRLWFGWGRGHEGPRPIVVAVCKEGWGRCDNRFVTVI